VSDTLEVLEPATEAVLAEVPRAGVEETDAAVARAKAAYPAWRAVAPGDRATLLHRLADALAGELESLAVLETRNAGKPIGDARGEMQMVVDTFRYYAAGPERNLGDTIPVAGGIGMTFREPLGVVALITPWNFPLTIAAWKLAPALAAGNAAVIKPSSLAPGAVITLVGILHEAGVPSNALQVLIGGAPIGEALADDAHVRALSFTGSNAVGKALGARLSARDARFQGELGGNNPLVVLADADVQFAARLACEGAFLAGGQKCTATRRVIAEAPVYDAMLEAMSLSARAMKVGPGLDEGVQVPPLVDDAAAKEVLAAIDEAKALGAGVASGGSAPGGSLSAGNFVLPTTLYDVTPGMSVIDDEVFGPVCAVLPAEDFAAAVRMANEVRFGLSASICTNDLERAFEFIEQSDAGMVHVNRSTPGADPHMPFGGLKASSASSYREQGEAAAQFFTEEQTVYLNWAGGA
jgi:acyl-CoA reductase-like NAD-dependent aldehyde dehydrogenase